MSIKPPGYWTKERCHEVALTCNSRTEFQKKYRGAYSSAHRNGWIDKICSHMEFIIKKPPGYWTKERCHEVALTCNSRFEFQKKYRGAYNLARKNGWLNEICSHMKKNK